MAWGLVGERASVPTPRSQKDAEDPMAWLPGREQEDTMASAGKLIPWVRARLGAAHRLGCPAPLRRPPFLGH